MLFSIIVFPLLNFFWGNFIGRFLSLGTKYIICINILLSFILSCDLLKNTITSDTCYKLILTPWITTDVLIVNWGFLFDSITIIMLLVVNFISLLVHLYSLEYMKNDPNINKFLSYLSLFTFFMLILVTADNFIQMFVGWEGVGLSSYLLINFWSTRIQANKASIKAMVVNRVGDFFILLSFFLIFIFFNSFDYDIVFSQAAIYKLNNLSNIDNFFITNIDFICLLLLFGAMGKSAQLGLHIWLPDAMEGPTPVSALIHAATMVTAGIFLIIRCSFLFELSNITLNTIIIIGSTTALFAASVGVFQNDMKKIIAYSTCSQLGYMLFSCGLSCYNVAMFHLTNHAFFKALLFLGAGAIIHAVSDEQDIRKLGGLSHKLPFTSAIFILGSITLCGFPFLSGFYSKDLILECAYSKYTTFSHFAYFLGIFAAFCTSFYSIRLISLLFLTKPRGSKNIIMNAHEPEKLILIPLIILAILSIFIGYFIKDLFVGFNTDFWKNSIYINPNNYILVDVEFLTSFYKILPSIFSLLGILLAYYVYVKSKGLPFLHLRKSKYYIYLYTALNKKWYFDRVLNQTISKNILNISFKKLYLNIDRGFLEIFGPYGLVQILNDKKYINKFEKKSVYILIPQIFIIFLFFLIIYVLTNISLINIYLDILVFLLIILLLDLIN